jgi:hydrogen peroxide-dependent heme synthase
VPSVIAGEGWGVLHLFFHVRRELLEGAEGAARDFAARIGAFDDREDFQALCFSVLGQKADFGIMAVGPDLAALDGLSVELAGSPLGQALLPAASYVSLTERSEYTPTEDDERRRLIEQEGLEERSTELDEALKAFNERIATYVGHRLYPQLPRRKVLSFYPMTKRRDGQDNWYVLGFEERKRIMSGHARVGRRHRGEVTQLVTGSVGLDDWEWGVTLFADDPKAIKDVVYEMRFDEASARYAEFGPFVTGLVRTPEDLMRHLHLT